MMAEDRCSDAEPASPTAPSVEQERQERARMFLLGWFGAIFDADETEEMCRLLTAFVGHETTPQPERVSPGSAPNTDAPRQNNTADPEGSA